MSGHTDPAQAKIDALTERVRVLEAAAIVSRKEIARLRGDMADVDETLTEWEGVLEAAIDDAETKREERS